MIYPAICENVNLRDNHVIGWLCEGGLLTVLADLQ